MDLIGLGSLFTASDKDCARVNKRRSILHNVVFYLDSHRDVVFGLSHAISAEQASIKSLLDYKEEASNETKTDNAETQKQLMHRILGGTQNSVLCQSNALVTSFRTLNKYIHDNVLSVLRGKDDSPVDTDRILNDENWIPVTGAPKGFEEEPEETDWEFIDKTDVNENGAEKNLWAKLHFYKQEASSREVKIKDLENDNKSLHLKIQELQSTIEVSESEARAAFGKPRQAEDNVNLKLAEEQARQEKSFVEQKATLVANIPQLSNKVAVQLHCQSKGDLVPKILDGLKTELVDKLNIPRHDLQFVTCLCRSDVDPTMPLLVLCINVSRIGTDARKTMQSIQGSQNVLLVILHHKDKHALPNQSSDRVLTGPEFQDLAGIYDIGFLADKGIYTCDMNSRVVDGIADFITKRQTTKDLYQQGQNQ